MSGTIGTFVQLDASGNEVALTGVVSIPVAFSRLHPLVVRPGLLSQLLLDFNLDQSLDVDLAANKVLVHPVFEADVDFGSNERR